MSIRSSPDDSHHLSRLWQTATRPARAALDIVLPPRCLSCQDIVTKQGTFCAACWPQLEFLTAPLCGRCGTALPAGSVHGLTCGRCLAAPPSFATARAVWRYDGAARAALLGFKHADRQEHARHFVSHMLRLDIPELADQQTMLVPVPLHRWRLWRRGYNQALELARALARLTGQPLRPDTLVRHRATVSQQGLDAEARRKNVTGAFSVPDRHAASIRGRQLLLLDDVITTGSTIESCTRALLKAGAARVSVLSVAMVVRE